MQPQYETTIKSLPPEDRRSIRALFRLPPRRDLWRALHHHDHAAVVLRLLHHGLVPPVERLIGHPIFKCPPSKRFNPDALPHSSIPEGHRLADPRVIIHVAPNPRLPTTPAFQRFRLFVVGRTIGEFYRRGGRRRDVLTAMRRGWIKVSGKRSGSEIRRGGNR